MKNGGGLLNESLWPPNGIWISPTTWTPSQSQDAEGRRRRGPKKKAHPILDLVRKSLEKRQSQLGPIGPHNRFDAFRIEFAMLYLAAYSPHVVLGLLHEVWNPNKISVTITLGKVSSRTISSVYNKVANELKSGCLVEDFPRGWLVALANYGLGPWHPRTPRWLAVVFSNAKIRVPVPPVRNHGWTTQSGNQAEIFDTSNAVETIISQHRDSRMALSPEEKSKRLERELKAIRKVIPDFTLSEDEMLVAWDLGLSAVRERRDQAMLAQAGTPQAKPSGSKDKNREKKARSKEVSSSISRSATGDIESKADMDSNALNPHSDFTGPELKPERAEEVAPKTVRGLEIGDLMDNCSNPHALPLEWYGRNLEALSDRRELKGEAERRDSIKLAEGRFEPLCPDLPPFPSCARYHFVDLKSMHDPIILPDIIFPNLNADTPKAAFDAWRNFDSGCDQLCSEYHEISERVLGFHHGLQDLSSFGITGTHLHPKLPQKGYMILFHWILELIVARTLGLRIYAEIQKSESDYLLTPAIWKNSEAFQYGSFEEYSAFRPITPLLNMLLRPVERKRLPKDYQWLLGWGAMPESVIKEAVQLYEKVVTGNLAKPELSPRQVWLLDIGRSIAVQRLCQPHDEILGQASPRLLTSFDLKPMFAILDRIPEEGIEWLDVSKMDRLWMIRSHEEGMFLKKIRSVTTQIHVPSLRLVNQHLFQS